MNDFDEYPKFSQADIDRATFRVDGEKVDKTTWQQAVKKETSKHKHNKNKIVTGRNPSTPMI